MDGDTVKVDGGVVYPTFSRDDTTWEDDVTVELETVNVDVEVRMLWFGLGVAVAAAVAWAVQGKRGW